MYNCNICLVGSNSVTTCNANVQTIALHCNARMAQPRAHQGAHSLSFIHHISATSASVIDGSRIIYVKFRTGWVVPPIPKVNTGCQALSVAWQDLRLKQQKERGKDIRNLPRFLPRQPVQSSLVQRSLFLRGLFKALPQLQADLHGSQVQVLRGQRRSQQRPLRYHEHASAFLSILRLKAIIISLIFPLGEQPHDTCSEATTDCRQPQAYQNSYIFEDNLLKIHIWISLNLILELGSPVSWVRVLGFHDSTPQWPGPAGKRAGFTWHVPAGLATIHRVPVRLEVAELELLCATELEKSRSLAY